MGLDNDLYVNKILKEVVFETPRNRRVKEIIFLEAKQFYKEILEELTPSKIESIIMEELL